MNQEILHTREVPWNDLSHDANGFMTRVQKVSFMRLDDLSVNLVCPSRVVPDRPNRHSQIKPLGPAKSLAIVECFKRSQFVRVPLCEIC